MKQFSDIIQDEIQIALEHTQNNRPEMATLKMRETAIMIKRLHLEKGPDIQLLKLSQQLQETADRMEEKYKEDQTDQLKDVIEELGPINTDPD